MQNQKPKESHGSEMPATKGAQVAGSAVRHLSLPPGDLSLRIPRACDSLLVFVVNRLLLDNSPDGVYHSGTSAALVGAPPIQPIKKEVAARRVSLPRARRDSQSRFTYPCHTTT
jgi:hypothetical protein